MRKFSLPILLAFLVSACQSSNDIGKCIGFNDKEDPAYTYHVDTRNLVLSSFFFQLLFPPALWYFNYAKCPVEKVTK